MPAMSFVFSFLIFSFSHFAQAQAVIHQEPSARHYYLTDSDENSTESSERDNTSVQSTATPLDYFDLSYVPEWDISVMQRAFEEARDRRFLYTSDRPDFARRITWLYPDDGCYARATLMSSNLEQMGLTRPAKIFIFGTWATLRVRTPYSPTGTAWWGFHVAPIVKAAGQYYVLDPSVEPKRPLLLIEWFHKLTRVPEKLKAAVCTAYSYGPTDPCNSVRQDVDSSALAHEQSLLRLEWERLKSLGMDPEKQLGDFPPWAQTKTQPAHIPSLR